MIRKITYSSIYFALIMVLTFTPYTGYITIGVVSITTIPAFVAIATWHIGSFGGFITALGFGLGSYFKALAGIGWPLFATAPELAIVPRILLWFFIWIIIKSFKEMKFWKVLTTCLICVILNTLLVTGVLFTINLYRNDFFAKSLYVWIGLIWINFLVEIFVAGFLGSLLWNPLKELKINFESQKKNAW